MARPAPPSDDGSPARLIAIMVGIVGILLLGSLAWSAVGALVSAVGAAGSALTAAADPTALTLATPAAAPTDSPTPVDVAAPTETPTVMPAPTDQARAATPGAMPSPTGTPRLVTTPVPTSLAAGRNPWILLPQPSPGAKVAAGSTTVEARGRGDAPISSIQLQLDGAALAVTMEQRSDSTWRGYASARVSAGEHSVRASVTDANGRVGSYRWSFSAD